MTRKDSILNPDAGTPAPSRRPWLAFALVALVSIAIGVAATMLLLRPRPAAVPAGPQATGAAGHEGMPGMAPAPGVPGAPDAESKAVYVSPARQQLVGVRTATVQPRDMKTTIRTVGRLAYDETRVAQIHTKISGWVDKVYVDYVGKNVRRDQPLLTVYSPELVSTQTEYLLALRNKASLERSPVDASRAAADALLAAARSRLTLWDIPEEHIRELEQSGKVQRTLMLHSPFDGIVTERSVFPGQFITPEMTTFKVVDLSRVWALGALFEYELPLVHVGQEAEIDFPYGQTAKPLKGKITFIAPEIDPQTRRVQIRAEFPNPGQKLKPETYVTVVIRTEGGQRLAVPKEAVIDNGSKRYVILARANGYFEPRELQVDSPTDDFYPIISGLAQGDVVVSSAQFLIDSETNLQAAMQSMMAMPGMDMSGGKDTKSKPPASQPAATASAAPAADQGGAMPGMDMSGGGDMKDMPMPQQPAVTPSSARPSAHSGHGK